jgi:hypothetical protein
MVLGHAQVAKAQECEANTGPAGVPPTAAGADAAEEVRMNDGHRSRVQVQWAPCTTLHLSGASKERWDRCCHIAAQEDDPLEAYMNAVQQEVAEDKPTNRARPGLEVDEQDNVAEYMEARHSSAPRIAVC